MPASLTAAGFRRRRRRSAEPIGCCPDRAYAAPFKGVLPTNPQKRDELWQDAKRRCRLSAEAVRMAREMGLNPLSLIKNIPSPTQRWKAPVEVWVREMYEDRHRAKPTPRSAAPGLTGGRVGPAALGALADALPVAAKARRLLRGDDRHPSMCLTMVDG